MSYKTIILIIAIFCHSILTAQPLFFTRTGNIQFFSKTPLEDIKAINKKGYSTLNTQTGAVQFLVQISQFDFKYAAMKDHFNDEDYMDSKKYPTAEFKGKITDMSAIDFTKNGAYNVQVEGSMTIHGITKAVSTVASIVLNKGLITGVAMFPVRLEDYHIKVPKIVFKKIAEVVEVTVNCTYLPYKN